MKGAGLASERAWLVAPFQVHQAETRVALPGGGVLQVTVSLPCHGQRDESRVWLYSGSFFFEQLGDQVAFVVLFDDVLFTCKPTSCRKSS
jgi:hypothetical protein